MADKSLLSGIDSPADVKKLTPQQLPQLCEEIRQVLIHTVSQTGGHLASNLGVVELTVALHRVFDSPEDKFVWDVGHQSYTHKLLTGRRERFASLRQEGGLSGFTRRSESEHDAFIAGHSSTSISAALGMTRAGQLQKKQNYVVAIIGDGALTGGMAYEALNDAGKGNDRLIVILNHNDMSISKNVGAFAKYLSNIRGRKGYLRMKRSVEKTLDKTPVIGKRLKNALLSSKSALKELIFRSTIFESLGFTYLGPVDGHNLRDLTETLENAKNFDKPVLIHVCTKKGKGYSFAEQNPGAYHGVSNFDAQKGSDEDNYCEDSFSCEFGRELSRIADQDDKICAVTAAMKYGTGLQYFARDHRERFFDVGIAEQHAVTFSAGLAVSGMLPVFCVYSTFLQRAYDQILHDAAIEKTHIVLGVDRAGVVGEDGETHQGVFDVSLLSAIPGVTIFSPSSYLELRNCLHTALYRTQGVVAVRYPRGNDRHPYDEEAFSSDNYVYQNGGGDVILLTYGREFWAVYQAAQCLREHGVAVSLLKLTRICPVDGEVMDILTGYSYVFFFEEGVWSGGVSQNLLTRLAMAGWQGHADITAIDDRFIPQAKVQRALQILGLDVDSIVQKVLMQVKRVSEAM